jgi:hypothetical protein
MSRSATREVSFRAFLLGMILFAAVPYGVWYVYDRFIKSDEDHIRELLLGAAEGAKERVARKVTEILAPDFRGPQNVDADDLHRFLVYVFLQQYKFIDASVSPDPLPVEIDPADKNKATAVFRVRAVGRNSEGDEWVPISRKYTEESSTELMATFVRLRDGWRMSKVEARSAPK